MRSLTMLRHPLGLSLCQAIWKRTLSTSLHKSSESPQNEQTSPSNGQNSPSNGQNSPSNETSSEPPNYETFTEVEVPVPWGHIAGKWWGSEDVTPVIALHGFEDNAGTYDHLAPLLDIPAVFAWDAPGHGRSSHMPVGHTYHFIDFVIALRLLVRRFGWQKISLIGHSWGSTLALVYTALYPDSVERYVSLDCARSIMPNVGVLGVDRLRGIVNHMIKCNDMAKEKSKPPQYNIRDVRALIVQGTFESVLPEHCDPLILRGSRMHPDNPEAVYFSRDHRLRKGDACRPSNDLIDEASQKVKCHVLSIIARQGFVYVVGEDVEKRFREQEAMMQKGAASFQSHLVKGSHHVHLNNPERVAPLINAFFSGEDT